MSKIRLTGGTSGYTEIQAADAAGNNVVTLPTTSNATILVSDSSGNVNIDSGTFYVDASNNRVGIGTTGPTAPLGFAGTTGRKIGFFTTGSTEAYSIGVESSELRFVTGTGGAFTFKNGDTYSTAAEYARIDTSGRLLVGTSTAATGSTAAQYARLQVLGNTVGNPGVIVLGSALNTASVSSGNAVGSITFTDAQAGEYAQIVCAADAAPGTNDYPGRLVFSTTADGASSPTERMRINNAGYSKFTNANTYVEGGGFSYHEFYRSGSGLGLVVTAADSSYASTVTYIQCTRAANSAYSLLAAFSDTGVDREFNLRGDGNAYADGSWNGGGADYAEYFEWSDGNADEEDRRGISVVLDGNKIRPAVYGEDPIGVISGNPSVVGDAAWNKWSGKYLRDDYASYILDENGERQLNPAYDPDVEYTSREERPEWDCVGLMGKLRIRKGQPTGNRWIKMRDISDSVEEWLVR